MHVCRVGLAIAGKWAFFLIYICICVYSQTYFYINVYMSIHIYVDIIYNI